MHADADSDNYINAERHAVLYPNIATIRDFNTIVDRHTDRPANGYAHPHNHNDRDIHANSYEHLNTYARSIEYADACRD